MADLPHLEDGPDSRRRRRERQRRRILLATAALPSLCTLGNAISGFAAIHFATRPLRAGLTGPEAVQWVHQGLVWGAWFILLAMVFDALDGRLARLTRRTSDFGGQLDSLCDAVSFGVAPAMLMLRAVQGVLYATIGEIDPHPQAPVWGKAIWIVAALFMACAILRLARFNVENEPDESAHMSFKGLPSPAAALAVASGLLLFDFLSDQGWHRAALAVIWALPAVTLAAGLLMISRFRYLHLINQYIRGRKPFGYLVKMLLMLLAAVLYFQVTVAVVALAYLLSGPVRWAVLRARRTET